MDGPDPRAGTAVLRVIAQVKAPAAGQVWWNGALSIRRRSGPHLGYLPNLKTAWFPEGVRVGETLDYFARLWLVSDVTDARQRELDRWGLRDRAHDRVDELSWGFQKRLGLAVSLVMNPLVWIADEPYAGLDRDGRLVLTEYLVRRFHHGLALIQDHTAEHSIPWRYRLRAEEGTVVPSIPAR
jgi:ABC-2 type transport system ATP-binding protein